MFSRVSRAAVVSDLSPERRWRIVLARDRRYDGAFVYGVRSTGIYCLPSCPSKKPRRRQVEFFLRPDTAERAGFRACRRCRPGQATPADPRVVAVREACRLIDAHPDRPATLAALAARCGTTSHRLARAFQSVLGVSPRAYRDERRLARFKSRLKEGKRVSPALYDAGYGSTSRVYERAHAHLGMTPATYRRGGPGVRIRSLTVPCSLGWLLVAATERGICRISFGDSTAPLERALRTEFPAAEIARDDGTLEAWVAHLVAHLDGRAPQLDLPLDVRATAFQRRVWEELQRIPYGSTRSYSAVARAIGKPAAARAVARACATNPAAVVIPCHRVVREDGALGGYRWGFKRKAALLARENAGVPTPG
jgi:AraC family transcriptional regulator, regulatory protein of adaptative response / methylated-DNA-[protein]-cysteine methyltransferase